MADDHPSKNSIADQLKGMDIPSTGRAEQDPLKYLAGLHADKESAPESGGDPLRELRAGFVHQPRAPEAQRPRPSTDAPGPKARARVAPSSPAGADESGPEVKLPENGESDFPADDDTPKILRQLIGAASSLHARQSDSSERLDTLLATVRPLRWIGWFLFLLSILDGFEIAYGLKLMNPSSELQAFGALVEKSALPLLGLGLISWGGIYLRARFELAVLHGLSWGALLFGLFYLALAPLIVLDSYRLDQFNAGQLNARQDKIEAEGRRAKERLESIQSLDQMERAMAEVAGKPIQLSREENLGEYKVMAAEIIERSRSEALASIEDARGEVRVKFWIRSIKWAIGAGFAGFVFFGVWWMTGWARRPAQNETEELKG